MFSVMLHCTSLHIIYMTKLPASFSFFIVSDFKKTLKCIPLQISVHLF